MDIVSLSCSDINGIICFNFMVLSTSISLHQKMETILKERFLPQVEAELTELDPEERSDYLQSLGVNEGGLGSLVRATYNLLGLRTYFTSGEKVRNLAAFPNCLTPLSTCILGHPQPLLLELILCHFVPHSYFLAFVFFVNCL